MIKVSGLTKIYTTHNTKKTKQGFTVWRPWKRASQKETALSNINFSIKKGEVVGLIGPNGAGKTTTMKILSGILYPTSGKVSVLGYEPFAKDFNYLRKISFIMGQRNQLMWDLPAMDSFILNKAIYNIDDTIFKQSFDELVELLDCGDIINQPVKTLSLGQRMRVEFIGALLHRPSILFLDEPTIGLDIIAQQKILDFLKSYVKKYNPTILFSSHYMRDVEILADRVIIINKGKLVYSGTLNSLIQKYGSTKRIEFFLRKRLSYKALNKIQKMQYEYLHPILRITVLRSNLQNVLEELLDFLPYSDVSVKDEPIEYIIQKTLNQS